MATTSTPLHNDNRSDGSFEAAAKQVKGWERRPQRRRKSRNETRCRPRFDSKVKMTLFLLLQLNCCCQLLQSNHDRPFLRTLAFFAAATEEEKHPEEEEQAKSLQCQREEDLDLEGCTLQDLPDEALISICERIGLDVEKHVFPYLLDEEEDDDTDEHDDDDEVMVGELKEEEEDQGSKEKDEHKTKSPQTKPVIRTHENYVQAATECLVIEDEMEQLIENDPEGLAELERAMLTQDPQLLAEIVADVLAHSPDLLAELEAELQREDPELFHSLTEALSSVEETEQDEVGEKKKKTLADKPEVLAELVAMMLAEDPDMLDKLDEDMASHMMIKHMSEDEDIDKIKEEEDNNEDSEGPVSDEL